MKPMDQRHIGMMVFAKWLCVGAGDCQNSGIQAKKHGLPRPHPRILEYGGRSCTSAGELQAHNPRHSTHRHHTTPRTAAKMSDGEVEVEAPQGFPVLPKEVTSEIGTTKLFNKWSYEDVEIRDISLTYV